ncbi:MAG: hypothetical protein JWP94_2861, partial [Mucilaginibacter sp.]|nr:hypothetical protein [Mucilaginibacter sp.]
TKQTSYKVNDLKATMKSNIAIGEVPL